MQTINSWFKERTGYEFQGEDLVTIQDGVVQNIRNHHAYTNTAKVSDYWTPKEWKKILNTSQYCRRVVVEHKEDGLLALVPFYDQYGQGIQVMGPEAFKALVWYFDANNTLETFDKIVSELNWHFALETIKCQRLVEGSPYHAVEVIKDVLA